MPPGTPAPFPSRRELHWEVSAIRRDRNLAPETAITDIACALRRSSIDTSSLDRVLRLLPEGAAEFWAVGGVACGWKVAAVLTLAREPFNSAS